MCILYTCVYIQGITHNYMKIFWLKPFWLKTFGHTYDQIWPGSSLGTPPPLMFGELLEIESVALTWTNK